MVSLVVTYRFFVVLTVILLARGSVLPETILVMASAKNVDFCFRLSLRQALFAFHSCSSRTALGQILAALAAHMRESFRLSPEVSRTIDPAVAL